MKRLIVFALATALGAAVFLGAQAPDIRITVTRVPLLVSVTDNKGKLITNLKKEDFRIYEDNKLQTITDFSSLTDLPLSIALLVDSSGSVIDKLKFEKEAASEFFFNTIKRKKDRAMVVTFESEVRILQDFTDEPETLSQAVNKIRAAGGTAFYDAVYLAVREKLSKEEGERRRLIIAITDGDDTQSKLSKTEALELAQRNDVTIFSVSTNKTSDTKTRDKQDGDKVLTEMAEETGGKVYFPLKLVDLAEQFERIGEELRSQYNILYEPTNKNLDGSLRKIRVEMVDKKYKATTRNSYYAERGAAATVAR